jgi:hypothetical protein
MKFLKAIENTQLLAVCSIYNLFRIKHLSREKNSDSTYIYKATLYRDFRTLRVTWLSKHERKDLGYGVLVRAEWLTKKIFVEGTNIIDTLTSVGSLLDSENLDTTLLPAWKKDPYAVHALLNQIDNLPAEYNKLINQVLVNHYVFYHFLKTPAALKGEFEWLGGLIEKTLLNLTHLESDLTYQRLQRPKEQLMAAVILLGISRYNQFDYDTRSHCYKKRSAKTKHDPRQVTVDLISKARKALDMENHLIFDRLISVILHEDFEYLP